MGSKPKWVALLPRLELSPTISPHLDPVSLHLGVGSPEIFIPWVGIIKLNFDGASKGNHGVKGIYSNYDGKNFLFTSSCEVKNNNVMEFFSLESCICLAIINGFIKIQVEGDLQMATNT